MYNISKQRIVQDVKCRQHNILQLNLIDTIQAITRYCSSGSSYWNITTFAKWVLRIS